jgi:cytochrome c551/c552
VNLDQILKTLEDNTSGGTLALPATAFGSGSIQTLLSAYLPAGLPLTIEAAQIGSDASSVTAQGNGATAPFAGTAVKAVFTVDADGQAALSLNATAASGWNLGTAFAQLNDSFLEKLNFSQVTLTLNSTSTATAFSLSTPPPLQLESTLGLGGSYAAVQWLLGDTATFDISGPVAINDDAPIFSFKLPIASKLNIGILGELQPAFVLSSKAKPWKDQSGKEQIAADLRFGMSTTIPLKGAAVPLFVDLSTPASLLTIGADLSQLANLGLSELGGYVVDADLASYVPSGNGFPGISAVAGLQFLLSPSARKIVSIRVQAAVSGDWPLIRGVSLTGAAVGFALLDPLGAKMIDASINGTVQWPGGALSMGAALRKTAGGVTADFFAALRDGSVIHLADILGYFLNADVPAQLDLDLFDFGLQVPSFNWYLQTGLTGDWQLPLGFTTVALTGASADLQRASGTTTGTIAAQATVAGIVFSSTWDLNKQFTLEGKFPDINLNELGEKLTGTTLPSSLPAIRITGAQATLVVANASRAPITLAAQRLESASGEKMYDFLLSASATSNGNPLGSAFFEVRRTAGANGYVLGLAVPATWSPGDLFPPLAPLFSSLTFSNTGVVVATIPAQNLKLPNLTMPVPASLQPGLTAFTTLKLKGNGLDLLSELFASDVTLNLVAVIDSDTPVNSLIQASLPAFSVNRDFTFKELGIDFKPGALEFSVVMAIALKIGNETLTINGSGAVKSEPPAVAIALALANWVEPFGISGLTVLDAGVSIKIGSVGAVIGMLGRFLIGQAPRSFIFMIAASIVDFEVPGALLFELQPTEDTLKLTDLIQQFTTLKLGSVPVLNAIAFKTISLAVVDDPNGFTIGTVHFDPGIRVTADVLFYDWEVDVDVAVNTKRGVYAKGSMNLPIDVGDGMLVLSDVAGTKGPSFLIDTAAFVSGVALVDRDAPTLSQAYRDSSQSSLELARQIAERPNSPQHRLLLSGEAASYLELNGKVQLLHGSIEQSIYLKASRDTLDFQYKFNFLGITEELSCNFSAEKMSLAASAKFGFSLKIDLPALEIAGVTVIPAIYIPGVSAGLTMGVGLQFKPVGGSFSMGLSFSLGGHSFSPGFAITLADIGSDIAQLWDAIATWLKNNVKKLFEDILKSIEAFADAIASGLISFGNDLVAAAKAIKAAFNATIEQVGEAFKQIGYAFEDAAKAIASAFNTTVEAVVGVLKDIWVKASEACSAVGANSLMLPGSGSEPPFHGLQAAPSAVAEPAARAWGQMLVDLAPRPGARTFLYNYYLHQPEMTRLMQTNATVHWRLRQANAASGPPQSTVEHFARVLEALQPSASPGLAASIGTMLRILLPYRSCSYAVFLQSFEVAA